MNESYGMDVLFRFRRRDRSLHVSAFWQCSLGVFWSLIKVLTLGQVLLEAVDGIVNEICKGVSSNLGVGPTSPVRLHDMVPQDSWMIQYLGR